MHMFAQLFVFSVQTIFLFSGLGPIASHAFLPPTLIKVPPTEVLGLPVLVGIILVRTLVVHIMLIVHVLSLLLRMALRLLAVEPVLSLCLGLYYMSSATISYCALL